MNKYIQVLIVFVGVLTVSCNNQQQYLNHKLQDEMALKRVVNDTSGQHVFYVTNATPKPRKRVSYTWYRNRTMSNTTGNYSGVLVNGIYEKFDIDNNIKRKGKYKKGVARGRWQQWYTNGTLHTISHYNSKGLLHGDFQSYTITKRPLLRGAYRQGKKQGVWIEGGDTLHYKKGKIYVKDTARPPFVKRMLQKFKKKDDGEDKAVKETRKTEEKEKKPSFFKRLFTKKTKQTT